MTESDEDWLRRELDQLDELDSPFEDRCQQVRLPLAWGDGVCPACKRTGLTVGSIHYCVPCGDLRRARRRQQRTAVALTLFSLAAVAACWFWGRA